MQQYSRGSLVTHMYHKYKTYYVVEAQYKDLVLIDSQDWTASKKYFNLITDIFSYGV